MFPDPETHRGGVKYVRDPARIARHYLRTWFTVDVISVGVSAVDFVVCCAIVFFAALAVPDR